MQDDYTIKNISLGQHSELYHAGIPHYKEYKILIWQIFRFITELRAYDISYNIYNTESLRISPKHP